MKKAFYILTFVLLTCFAFGQSDTSGQTSPKIPHLTKNLPHEDRIFAPVDNPCDSIRKNPDTLAKYKNGTRDILDFFKTKIQPVVETCYKNEGHLITSLKIQLTIDRNGKVIAAYVIKPDIPLSCKTPIQNEFLKMDNWTPAKQKGINVCSKMIVPINCIKWQ